MKRIVMSMIVVLLSYGAITSVAMAQSGLGTDMWTRRMQSMGLFKWHKNNCTTDEVFVAIAGEANRGFCIEKNERPSAQWEDARNDCLEDGKRLPEPGEYKFACDAGIAGLNDMDDGDYEWASNHPLLVADSGAGVAVPVWGKNTCAEASYRTVGWNGGGLSESTVYRCVR